MSVTRLQASGGTSQRAALVAALQASGHQLFELDPRSGAMAWPASGPVGVLGHPAAAIDSLAAWLELVHPEDRATVRADLLDCRRETDPSLPAACARVRDARGEFRWIELRGARLVEAGRALCVGTLLDVTARRQAQQRLALSARILETIREAVAVADSEGRILWANAAFGALLGLPCERLTGLGLQQFSGAAEARRIEQLQDMRDAIARRGAWQGRVDARRHDGTALITEASVSAVAGELGDLWVHVYRDVTERIALDEAVLAMSRAEQQRLGLELHDSLGQELAGASMLVRTLRKSVSAGAGADTALLRDVETLLQSSIARCRDLAQAVSPFVIDENGLGAAIQDLVHRARASTGLAAIRADVCARAARFDGNFGYHLYRLAQLLLQGVLARDGVVTVDLQLWWEEDDRVALAVVADGAATPLRGDPADGRLLRHCLALLGGHCEPLQADRGRSGLIALVPVSASGFGAAVQDTAPCRAIRA